MLPTLTLMSSIVLPNCFQFYTYDSSLMISIDVDVLKVFKLQSLDLVCALLYFRFLFPTLLQEVKENPNNYDAWFDLVRLVESDLDDFDAIRDVYERAISNIPPINVRHTDVWF